MAQGGNLRLLSQHRAAAGANGTLPQSGLRAGGRLPGDHLRRVAQRAVLSVLICLMAAAADVVFDSLLRTGGRQIHHPFAGDMVQGGDRFGLGLAAAGACIGFLARSRAGGGLGHRAAIPAMPEGRDGFSFLFAAICVYFQPLTGIGYFAIFRAGRRLCDNTLVPLVTERGIMVGIALSAL